MTLGNRDCYRPGGLGPPRCGTCGSSAWSAGRGWRPYAGQKSRAVLGPGDSVGPGSRAARCCRGAVLTRGRVMMAGSHSMGCW
jgi:hypothetical protein